MLSHGQLQVQLQAIRLREISLFRTEVAVAQYWASVVKTPLPFPARWLRAGVKSDDFDLDGIQLNPISYHVGLCTFEIRTKGDHATL